MNKQSAQPVKHESRIVRYWHPRLGGWYHARLVRVGRKWVVVRDLSPNGKVHRLAIDKVNRGNLLTKQCQRIGCRNAIPSNRRFCSSACKNAQRAFHLKVSRQAATRVRQVKLCPGCKQPL